MENRASIWVIVWRFPWWCMAHALRVLLVAVVFMGWGRQHAAIVWDKTK